MGHRRGDDLANRPAPPAPPPAQTPTQWTDDQPLTRLPQNLGHDLANLVRRQNVLTAAVGLGAAAVTHKVDDDVSEWATESGSSSYSGLGGVLGSAWFQAGSAVGTYTVGRLAHRPAITHIGSDLIRAQLLNGVLTTTLKAAVGRTRPNGGDFSFPSGHTSATFASAAVLGEHFGWRVGVPAYAVAGFVGWTRVRDNNHWVSDVAFGTVIGIIAGRTVASTHRHAGWTVTPVATRGGGGVFFVKQ